MIPDSNTDLGFMSALVETKAEKRFSTGQHPAGDLPFVRIGVRELLQRPLPDRTGLPGTRIPQPDGSCNLLVDDTGQIEVGTNTVVLNTGSSFVDNAPHVLSKERMHVSLMSVSRPCRRRLACTRD